MRLMMTCVLLSALVSSSAVFAQVKLGEPKPDPEKDKAAAVERAKCFLAEKEKIDKDALSLESATAKSWPDAAIGCPEKGRMYAQVVTPGYRVVLKTAEKSYVVHVAGKRAVMCPEKSNQ